LSPMKRESQQRKRKEGKIRRNLGEKRTRKFKGVKGWLGAEFNNQARVIKAKA